MKISYLTPHRQLYSVSLPLTSSILQKNEMACQKNSLTVTPLKNGTVANEVEFHNKVWSHNNQPHIQKKNKKITSPVKSDGVKELFMILPEWQGKRAGPCLLSLRRKSQNGEESQSTKHGCTRLWRSECLQLARQKTRFCSVIFVRQLFYYLNSLAVT